MIVLDVDGVLTDAGLMMGVGGFEYMKFNVQDGAGIVMARRLGYQFAIITGRKTRIILNRAKHLGIMDVYQQQIDKLPAYLKILAKYELKDEQVLYMGDDILDIPILQRVGFAVAPANGVAEVKQIADLVTKRSGGEGAVREAIDYLLMHTGLKKIVLDRIRKGKIVGVSV
ncbi:MAG: HAD hydrolase family protein [Deltaproteobacteria bacterium]|nr:HAD hydrolase family protein [Deltaproteobacteria bacterium]